MTTAAAVLVGMIVIAGLIRCLTLASWIGLGFVSVVLCCGLPVWGELAVIYGATLVTATLNRQKEARRIAAAAQQGEAGYLDAIEAHAAQRLATLRYHGD